MPGGLSEQSQALNWTAAFLLGISLGRWIGRWRDRQRSSLRGTVANSSRLIAAWRAVESLELEGKLFTDDLAVALAGQDLFASALAAAQPITQEEDAGGAPGRRLYQISQVAARTYWFDRQIMTALTSPAVPASKGWLSSRLRGSFSARGPSAPPRQVVVVGAGMCARAWRLPLPPGCTWYEIDNPDVLEAKCCALSRAGAEVPGLGGAGLNHPLRCERWVAIDADVNDEGWFAKLELEGFDTSKPTIWVLEGILMYLSQESALALLAATAAASAPGSTLLLHSLTDEAMDRIREGDFAAAPGSFYSPQLVETWQSSLPKDPASVLEEAGWLQQSVVTRAGIATQICGGAPEGKCAFETNPGEGADRHVVFSISKKGIP